MRGFEGKSLKKGNLGDFSEKTLKKVISLFRWVLPLTVRPLGSEDQGGS